MKLFLTVIITTLSLQIVATDKKITLNDHLIATTKTNAEYCKGFTKYLSEHGINITYVAYDKENRNYFFTNAMDSCDCDKCGETRVPVIGTKSDSYSVYPKYFFNQNVVIAAQNIIYKPHKKESNQTSAIYIFLNLFHIPADVIGENLIEFYVDQRLLPVNEVITYYRKNYSSDYENIGIVFPELIANNKQTLSWNYLKKTTDGYRFTSHCENTPFVNNNLLVDSLYTYNHAFNLGLTFK